MPWLGWWRPAPMRQSPMPRSIAMPKRRRGRARRPNRWRVPMRRRRRPWHRHRSPPPRRRPPRLPARARRPRARPLLT
ncbi:MAG: hypothetical protein FJX52_03970, partial [Alphaproteobacteria bacterium]|nr:hypothetical protein [Alphaproteobacteria bacterium]